MKLTAYERANLYLLSLQVQSLKINPEQRARVTAIKTGALQGGLVAGDFCTPGTEVKPGSKIKSLD